MTDEDRQRLYIDTEIANAIESVQLPYNLCEGHMEALVSLVFKDRKEIERLKKENEKLQEIINDLPLTADKVRVSYGDRVWIMHEGKLFRGSVNSNTTAMWRNGSIPVSDMFSTPAVARGE